MSDELSQLRMRLKAEWHDEPVTSKPLTQTPPKIEETSKPVEVTSSLEDQTVKVSSFQQSEGTEVPTGYQSSEIVTSCTTCSIVYGP